MKWWPVFNFFIMANADIPLLSTLRKPNFGGVSNLKFFHRIDIYEMVAIFQFFHTGQCRYRSGMVNSKSFVGKVLLQIKWKFELN